MASVASAAVPPAVIDASVSLKWVLNDEDYTGQALSLRRDAFRGALVMIASSLWVAEVTTALVVGVRRNRITAGNASQLLETLNRAGVELVHIDGEAMLATALRFGIAAYDAAYLALAVQLQAPLWTGDRRFYDAVARAEPLVRWIGDY